MRFITECGGIFDREAALEFVSRGAAMQRLTAPSCVVGIVLRWIAHCEVLRYCAYRPAERGMGASGPR
jgi:hypothetical protein